MEKYKIHYSREEYRNNYLRSKDWKEKSNFILKRDKICRICDKSKSVHSHHLTYERIEFENLDTDLIGVCKSCHNKIHSWSVLSRCKNVNKIKKILNF